MKTVSDIQQSLPKRIGSFDFITETFLSIPADRESFVDYYKEIPSGSLQEVLASYDNHLTCYSMRVRGRGEDLHVVMEYMEIIRDHIGPLAAQTIEAKEYRTWDLSNIFADLIQWVKKDETPHPLRKTVY